jgi:hypothetical protein
MKGIQRKYVECIVAAHLYVPSPKAGIECPDERDWVGTVFGSAKLIFEPDVPNAFARSKVLKLVINRKALNIAHFSPSAPVPKMSTSLGN